MDFLISKSFVKSVFKENHIIPLTIVNKKIKVEVEEDQVFSNSAVIICFGNANQHLFLKHITFICAKKKKDQRTVELPLNEVARDPNSIKSHLESYKKGKKKATVYDNFSHTLNKMEAVWQK